MEHFARINLVAELLGGARALPQQEVRKLIDSRERYGVPSHTSGEPDCPTSAEKLASGNGQDRFQVTREELIQLVEDALLTRGA